MRQTQITIEEIFDDVSMAEGSQRGLLKLVRDMMFRLAEVYSEDDLYRHIGRCLQDIMPNSIVMVNSFDETSRLFQLRAILSRDVKIQRLTDILGTNPLGMSLPINEVTRSELMQGKLKRIEGGLRDLSHGVLTAEFCLMLQKHLGISHVYVTGLTHNSELLGSANFLMLSNDAPVDVELIQSIIHICSSALYKSRQSVTLNK
jgi:hypothetical protein